MDLEKLQLEDSANKKINITIKKIKIVVLMIMIAIAFSATFLLNEKYKTKDIQIAKVGNEVLYYKEYISYLKAGIDYYEKEAGKDIWSINVNNTNMFDILKKHVLEDGIMLVIETIEAEKIGIKVKENKESKTYRKEMANELRKKIDSEYVVDEEEIDKYVINKKIEKEKEKGNEIDNNIIRNEYIELKKKEIYKKYQDRIYNNYKNQIKINFNAIDSIKYEDVVSMKKNIKTNK